MAEKYFEKVIRPDPANCTMKMDVEDGFDSMTMTPSSNMKIMQLEKRIDAQTKQLGQQAEQLEEMRRILVGNGLMREVRKRQAK